MDPDRVHAYLQAACAGLGFDIGEVWWTSDENGSSSLAAIEEGPSQGREKAGKKFRFVQLYTSKSYENRRAELVNPPQEDVGEATALRTEGDCETAESLKEHVLSPRLVDAISRTTQVIWATTKKQEGLTGRSDIRLQTAVGMPVAVDEDGNMCIVVMFSPNNIQSSDEAMEYLQSISQSATSSNIPCLLPVFNSHTTHPALPPVDDNPHRPHHHHHLVQVQVPPSVLGEGVNARFVSLDEAQDGIAIPATANYGANSDYELVSAPKDTFGMPMLPAGQGNVTPEEALDVFDEASYGIWSTIMDSLGEPLPGLEHLQSKQVDAPEAAVVADPSLLVPLPPPSRTMSDERRDRLGEFCEAFLEMSVFDYADVWVPAAENGYADCLRYTMSSMSNVNAGGLNEFRAISVHALIKFWTGAVGRAYSSGNPVWSANPKVFVDAARADVFERSRIQTVLAVPVFANGSSTPACVVACYSLVRNTSIPFVLRFVQQALRLLWQGIDDIEPNVDHKIWKDVAPADLGEMAADMEMQQHFMSKKRPYNRIADEAHHDNDEMGYLASGLQRVELPNGETVEVPLQLPGDELSVPLRVETVQNHMTQALRHVRDFQPYDRNTGTISQAPKRQHFMGNNGSIGQPLQRPRGFPKTIVPSNTSLTGSIKCVNQASLAAQELPSLSYTIVHPVQKPAPSSFSEAPVELRQMAPAANQFYNMFEIQAMEPLLLASGRINSTEPVSMQQELSGTFCLPVQVSNFPPVAQDSVVSIEVEGDESGVCRIDGCFVPTVSRRPYCEQHSGNRLCEYSGCGKCAQGSTRYCIAHGGGRRCTFPGCDKGARDKFFCAAHGGGKRCSHGVCTKSAVGGSNLCTAHGGGRRCAIDGCNKSAQSSTKFCVKHGGGKKCAQDGCEKVARGRTQFCAAHGGGVRCKLDGCNRVAIGRMQLCRSHGGTSSRSRKLPSSSPSNDAAVEMMNLNEALRQQQLLHTMAQQQVGQGLYMDQQHHQMTGV